MNQYDLRGRQAVVTGGASGLGYAIAERLSASGAKVVIWDRDEKAGRSAAAALAGHFVLVDVSDLAAVTRAVPATLGDVAAIDILVNNASVAGKDGNPNASAYSASKAAVIALTKSLGKELADTDIRVNCVTPAAVRTPLFAQMTQSHIDYMLSKIPMGRFGEPQEIAALVTWLATPECSFSTGAVFDLSGGRSTY